MKIGMLARKMFEPMYGDKTELYTLAEGSSYSSEARLESAGEIAADVQPCGGSVEERDYGLTAERDARMYCDEHEALAPGNFVRTGGVLYRIERVDKRELGVTVYLKGCGE